MDTDVYPLGLDADYNAKPKGNEMGSPLIHRWEGKVSKAKRKPHCGINQKICKPLNLGRLITSVRGLPREVFGSYAKHA